MPIPLPASNETTRHRYLLLFWPLYLLSYVVTERLFLPETYHVVACGLDKQIPFLEIFLIPYVFWYLFQMGMVLYTLRYDVPVFRRYMHFVILTYSAATVVFLLYPSCQQLRPEVLPRENVLSRGVSLLYRLDTSTNVCPSVHVIGSVAVALAAGHTERFSTGGWRAVFWLTALSICASTWFLKQHSVIDFLVAIPLCMVAYLLCFYEKRQTNSPAE